MHLPLFAQRRLSSRVGEGVKGVKGFPSCPSRPFCLSRPFLLFALCSLLFSPFMPFSCDKKKDAPLQGIL